MCHGSYIVRLVLDIFIVINHRWVVANQSSDKVSKNEQISNLITNLFTIKLVLLRMWNFSYFPQLRKNKTSFFNHFVSLNFPYFSLVSIYSFFLNKIFLHMMLFHPTHQANVLCFQMVWEILCLAKNREAFYSFPPCYFCSKNPFASHFFHIAFVSFSSQTIVSVASNLFFCHLESAENSIVRHRNRDRMVTMALCWISALTHRRERNAAVTHVSDCGFW